MLVMPDVVSGSCQYDYALATAKPLPAACSSTATEAMTMAVARIIVVK